jgi:hypothetical protein
MAIEYPISIASAQSPAFCSSVTVNSITLRRSAQHAASADRTRMKPMTVTAPPASAEKMKTVKAAWDKAPAGPKKDAALKHYQAAEKAHTAKDEAGCIKELDAATAALV